jgi:peptidoglycan/LPS O-acetylase OafA/YrhL
VKEQPQHVPELDGIRGLAALAVVAFHAPTLLDGAHWSTAAARWTRGGWLGVDAFFALSGYLITRGLLKAREEPHYFARFYGKRALRILPLYFLYLGALVLASPLLPARYYDPAEGDLAFFATLMGNIPDAVGRYPGACLSPLWSLAVEEHWYLLWPLLVWQRTARRLIAVCAGIFLVAIGTRALAETFLAPHASHMLTPCRLDGLAAGAVVSLFARLRGDASVAAWCRDWAPFAVATLLLVALTPFGPSIFPYVYPSELFQRVGHSATAVAAAVLVGASGYGAERTRWLRWRPLVHVGQVSYGIYLLHAAVGAALTLGVPGITRLPLELGCPLLMAATVFVATVVHRLVEAPALRLRRYLP